MGTAVGIVEGKLREKSGKYGISASNAAWLTTDPDSKDGGGGCEWTIRMLQGEGQADRAQTVSDLIEEITPALSSAWLLASKRYGSVIRLTPAPQGFEQIEAASRSIVPMVFSLVLFVVSVFVLAYSLDLF